MTAGRKRQMRTVLLALAAAAALVAVVALAGCGGSAGQAGLSATPAPGHSSAATPKVTFLELGSNSCIPCKEMRPVMKGIEQTFGDQVEVIFYDVWEDPAPANEYGVQMIPTQIFLDEKGEEFHRHTGFYPQADIEALLVEQGLAKTTTQ
jgi:thioredoxin 1